MQGNNNKSLYDCIPNLDSWYAYKDEPTPYQTRYVSKTRRCNNKSNMGVSFSVEPPSVYHYEKEQRSSHKRQLNSESVKVFFKRYTNKLSKQLNPRIGYFH
ncbi:hypothetical protein K501DRAFT_332421 [Backusella circina FSU 941]|nr:hypothetical protein K501DRAFT_332421 [Backusella circina FSU 941]